MIRLNILALVFMLTNSLFAQTKERSKTENWIEKNEIVFSSPAGFDGYEQLEDCKGRPMFRKNVGDSIILYSWGGSIAEDLKTFKESTKKADFNKLRYPTEVQNNGTVVVTKLSRDDFIWRNDSLYLWDDYNKPASDARMAIIKEKWAGTISAEEYKSKLENFDETLYPFEPQYKLIYFSGMFNDGRTYEFTEEENFRKESVELKASWEEHGERMLEFNLDTYTNGRYRISMNLEVLEDNNCR